jgi:hypothetical protein
VRVGKQVKMSSEEINQKENGEGLKAEDRRKE